LIAEIGVHLPVMRAHVQVRKRAQACVVEVLAGLQASPVLVAASEALARISQAVLKGPEVRPLSGLPVRVMWMFGLCV